MHLGILTNVQEKPEWAKESRNPATLSELQAGRKKGPLLKAFLLG
jgi:hypothetical protein